MDLRRCYNFATKLRLAKQFYGSEANDKDSLVRNKSKYIPEGTRMNIKNSSLHLFHKRNIYHQIQKKAQYRSQRKRTNIKKHPNDNHKKG